MSSILGSVYLLRQVATSQTAATQPSVDDSGRIEPPAVENMDPPLSPKSQEYYLEGLKLFQEGEALAKQGKSKSAHKKFQLAVEKFIFSDIEYKRDEQGKINHAVVSHPDILLAKIAAKIKLPKGIKEPTLGLSGYYLPSDDLYELKKNHKKYYDDHKLEPLSVRYPLSFSSRVDQAFSQMQPLSVDSLMRDDLENGLVTGEIGHGGDRLALGIGDELRNEAKARMEQRAKERREFEFKFKPATAEDKARWQEQIDKENQKRCNRTYVEKGILKNCVSTNILNDHIQKIARQARPAHVSACDGFTEAAGIDITFEVAVDLDSEKLVWIKIKDYSSGYSPANTEKFIDRMSQSLNRGLRKPESLTPAEERNLFLFEFSMPFIDFRGNANR